MRPQRRKPIYRHRFSLASLGEVCPCTRPLWVVVLGELEGPTTAQSVPLLHPRAGLFWGALLSHAIMPGPRVALSLEYSQILIHSTVNKYLLTPFSVPGTLPSELMLFCGWRGKGGNRQNSI